MNISKLQMWSRRLNFKADLKHYNYYHWIIFEIVIEQHSSCGRSGGSVGMMVREQLIDENLRIHALFSRTRVFTLPFSDCWLFSFKWTQSHHDYSGNKLNLNYTSHWSRSCRAECWLPPLTLLLVSSSLLTFLQWQCFHKQGRTKRVCCRGRESLGANEWIGPYTRTLLNRL